VIVGAGAYEIFDQTDAFAVVIASAMLTLAAGSVLVLMIVFEYSGGITPSYRATNHDRRLTPIALEAVPIIQSIDRYYKAHGHCPNESENDLAELRNVLPEGMVATLRAGKIEFRPAKAIPGWSYYSTNNDRTTCKLSRKLGWDPDLVWWRRGDETTRIFIPGDGSEEIPIDLDVQR